MTFLNFSRCAFGMCAAAAMLTGCGGSQPPTGASAAIPKSPAYIKHAARARSWMLPEAASQDLLYVANNNGTVTVYSYPQGKMVGTLLGFDVPRGECVDSSGDVFITVYVLQQIREYAHGGTKPIAILSDSGYNPWSCSVDPTTGNLAVASQTGISIGAVSIYAKAKGVPKIFQTNILSLYCGYDNKGNLFASGDMNGGTPALVELAKGAHKFKNVAFTANVVGAIQWDGKYLAIGDGYGGGARMDIYRFSIANGKATKKGGATLIGSNTTAFSIQGSTVAALNDYANVGIWSYPRGGYPTKIIYHGVDRPDGVAISPAANK